MAANVRIAAPVAVGAFWKVTRFVALDPVIAPMTICSEYVPAATLNVTGPLTPEVVNAETAAVNDA